LWPTISIPASFLDTFFTSINNAVSSLVAIAASQINASINGVKLEVRRDDLIGSSCDPFDVIVVGDMLYDSELANTINIWLNQLRKQGKRVLVGDPGRGALNSLTSEKPYCWCRLAKYELDDTTKQDNYGFNHTFVMTLL
jgi:ETFB lysine methyltransferase